MRAGRGHGDCVGHVPVRAPTFPSEDPADKVLSRPGIAGRATRGGQEQEEEDMHLSLAPFSLYVLVPSTIFFHA